MSLFERTLNFVKERRDRILSGKINCIPWGFPRFEKESPGIEQGKYYLITASSKSAKTQLTDWLFLYNVVQQVLDNNLNIRIKIFYFSLEMSKEEKMLACFSNILYVKENIRIAPKDLKSTSSENPLSEDVLKILDKYKPYFDKIEEIVEFIDDTRNPTGIYDIVRKYALANGTLHYRNIVIKDEITKVEDYYEPNDPDEYVMIIIDHISLISTERRNGQILSLHESISVLSSDYLIKLRNRFKYIPVVIQQQALAGENLEHKKLGSLKPSAANLSENKTTIRDCNMAISIFSPFKHEIPDYYGYDITKLQDNSRFIEIMASRDGGANSVFPLYFDGAVNYFSELPLPKDKEGILKVYNYIDKIRK